MTSAGPEPQIVLGYLKIELTTFLVMGKKSKTGGKIDLDYFFFLIIYNCGLAAFDLWANNDLMYDNSFPIHITIIKLG